MPTPLLATKLSIPPARPGLVPRPQLTRRLSAGLVQAGQFTRKLTLVCAPAGFGKTTLVRQWLDELALPGAWLSLDDGDNDPARFLAYLMAALQQVDPSIGHAAHAMLESPQPSAPELVLTSLINDITAAPQAFLLVLDDYHLIQTLAIHQQLAFLLGHLPAALHLVVASREELPLPLHRLRAGGQLLEIRQADLRFDVGETAEFLQRTMHLGLSPVEAATLQRRTEGWIVGLQLAALSLQGSADPGRFVQTFAGSDRHVLDYLMDEVFQQQPPAVQDFLLQTSILDRLSAGLCDAILEITPAPQAGDGAAGQRAQGSQRILSYLDTANLFVIPLDHERHWYRYHRLFADLLRHRLERDAPRDLSALHRRASQWYADNGFAREAVQHALAARDWSRASELITAGASESLLKQGEVVTLLGWCRALPEDVICGNPELCLECAWTLILTDQLAAAQPYLARVEQSALARENPEFLGQVLMAQAHMARAQGDYERTMALSERALALLAGDEVAGRTILLLNLGMARWFCGRMAEAETLLVEAERAGRVAGNAYAQLTAQVFLNRVQAAHGRLQQAFQAGQRIVEQGGQAPIVAIAHIDLGRLCYEWDDLDAATDHFQQGIDLARRTNAREFLAVGHGALALVRQAQGGGAVAQDLLREAVALLDQPGTSPSAYLGTLAIRVLVALDQDDLHSAALAAAQAPRPEDAGSFPDALHLMAVQARLLLAQGKREAAAQHLAALYELAAGAGWQSYALQARAMQALAADTPAEALALLAEALALAEPGGYTRTFLDLGDPMAALLLQGGRLRLEGWPAVYANRLLAAFSGRMSSATSAARLPIAEAPGAAPQPGVPETTILPEALSDRELAVLRLLADGSTNQEIARDLVVSVNTVKTHLKNIYGKLGVRTRRQAVARARDLGLLP